MCRRQSWLLLHPHGRANDLRRRPDLRARHPGPPSRRLVRPRRGVYGHLHRRVRQPGESLKLTQSSYSNKLKVRTQTYSKYTFKQTHKNTKHPFKLTQGTHSNRLKVLTQTNLKYSRKQPQCAHQTNAKCSSNKLKMVSETHSNCHSKQIQSARSNKRYVLTQTNANWSVKQTKIAPQTKSK